MNEIIGPIYYVLSSDPDEKWSRYAEADTFYCFTRVMSEIRDNFIQSMDSSTSGIHANMNKGMALTDLTTNQKSGFNCQIFEPWSSIHPA